MASGDWNAPEARVLTHLQLDEDMRLQVRLQDSLSDYMRGWLVHVGMMPVEDLVTRAAALTKMEGSELEAVMDLCRALIVVRDGSFQIYADEEGEIWALHPELEDPERLLRRLREPHIAALPYPDFEEGLLGEGGCIGLPGEPGLYAELLKWLEAHDVQDSVGLLEAAVYYVQDDNPNDGLRLLTEIAPARNREDFEEVAGMFFALSNRIPRWSNKGHSPEELFRAERVQRVRPKMPGRNDPCPCGSGRKYKVCCGRRVN